ncbi:Folliculin [Lamellibrachia satsuma]|nr:Folliculin [Lamellibrachia satsuma]
MDCLLQVFGYSQFHVLAHHVVIGNQVIVRGTRHHLVQSVIDALKTLLPRGCCHVINYSLKYEDTWRCNFLGLHPSTPLPPHADLYVTVTLKEPATEIVETTPTDRTDDLFQGYKFSVETSSNLPASAPKILGKIEAVLQNDQLADPVVDQCLTCLKEEWMNKVKVLFRFTKAGGSRSEEDTRKLLHVVGAEGEDKAVLKFWMTGLSVQYRNHMLSSAISGAVS